jgi:hypothetical protein
MDKFKLHEFVEQAIIDKHKIDDIDFAKYVTEA